MIEYTCIAALSKFASINSQKGVTIIEYSLLAALVAVAAIATMTVFGEDLGAAFTALSTKIAPAP